MTKKTIIFILTFLIIFSFAGCEGSNGKNDDILGEGYPKDIFKIYDRAAVEDFSRKPLEDGGEAFNVKALSKDKVSEIADYYKVLLQNADTSEQTQTETAFLMKGRFYGYDFAVDISENEAGGKTVLTISLERKAGEAEGGEAAAQDGLSRGEEGPGEQSEGDARHITFNPNLLINGTPYYMEPEPVWADGQLWLPGLEFFGLMGCDTVDYDTWIGFLIHEPGEPPVTCCFVEGDASYGTDDERFQTDFPPVRYNGLIYISNEMINSIFGEVLLCRDTDVIANLRIESRYPQNPQQGNGDVFRKLALKDVYALGDTRLSTMVSGCYNTPADDWLGWIDGQRAEGFTEIRFSVNHTDNANPDYALTDFLSVERDFPDEYKKVFQYAHDKGMTVRYVLGFWDYAYRAQGGGFSYDRLGTQDEIDRYVEYVKMTVSELRGLVDRYELWNEPDANYPFHQSIKARDYINMAVQAIPAIKEIDPDAEVIMLSSCGFLTDEETEYTMSILSSDAAALADGISLHTVNMDAMPQNRSEYYYGYENMMNRIRDTAKANGFDGVVIADELNYRSHYSINVLQPEDTNFFHATEPEIAAKNIARMMVINRGIGIFVGMSGTGGYDRKTETITTHNYNRLMDGLAPAEIDMAIESGSDMIRSYSFADENGDLYIAVWNDGAADVVSGYEKCTITAGGISAGGAEWLDAYYAVQKNLDFTNGENGITIENLFVPDYPIFIKIDTTQE